jgi:hypothetical protein
MSLRASEWVLAHSHGNSKMSSSALVVYVQRSELGILLGGGRSGRRRWGNAGRMAAWIACGYASAGLGAHAALR